MNLLFKCLEAALRPFGYRICPWNRAQVVPGTIPDAALYQGPEDFSRLYRPWLGPAYDARFRPEVVEHTMLSRKKLYYLFHFLQESLAAPGDIFEAGVGSGGSARLMLDCLVGAGTRREMWLLDTFAGYQKVDAQADGAHVQLHQCRGQDRARVAELLENESVPVHLIEGLIPGTLAEVKAQAIAFAHIDVNLYEPTRAATEFCLGRMSRGGIILFDDYNWPATYGARRAIDEVCAARGQRVICLAESTQAFLIKR